MTVFAAIVEREEEKLLLFVHQPTANSSSPAVICLKNLLNALISGHQLCPTNCKVFKCLYTVCMLYLYVISYFCMKLLQRTKYLAVSMEFRLNTLRSDGRRRKGRNPFAMGRSKKKSCNGLTSGLLSSEKVRNSNSSTASM